MMKKILHILLVITATLLLICGCTQKTTKENDKLQVVVTAFPHYDFVRQIAKDNVDLTMLIKPGNELHTYDPSPSDMAKISTCDIFIYTGGESDTWAKSILSSASNKDMTVISFTDICTPKLCDNTAFGTSEETNTHDAHNHNYDEHVWTSPVNAKTIAKKIFDVLCDADEKNKAVYTENYSNFERELTALDELFKSVVSQGKRKEIVVGDRFPFSHLAQEYGIEYHAAFPGCSSETEPSAKTVAHLSQKLKEELIPVVFTVEFSNKKVAKTIVSDTGAEILTLHSCHNVTNDEFLSKITYVELMTQNAENLRKALN